MIKCTRGQERCVFKKNVKNYLEHYEILPIFAVIK